MTHFTFIRSKLSAPLCPVDGGLTTLEEDCGPSSGPSQDKDDLSGEPCIDLQ